MLEGMDMAAYLDPIMISPPCSASQAPFSLLRANVTRSASPALYQLSWNDAFRAPIANDLTIASGFTFIISRDLLRLFSPVPLYLFTTFRGICSPRPTQSWGTTRVEQYAASAWGIISVETVHKRNCWMVVGLEACRPPNAYIPNKKYLL